MEFVPAEGEGVCVPPFGFGDVGIGPEIAANEVGKKIYVDDVQEYFVAVAEDCVKSRQCLWDFHFEMGFFADLA